MEHDAPQRTNTEQSWKPEHSGSQGSRISVSCRDGIAYLECQTCAPLKGELESVRATLASIANFAWTETGSDTFEEAFDWCKSTAKDALRSEQGYAVLDFLVALSGVAVFLCFLYLILGDPR